MGICYHVHCEDCGYDQRFLLGQGADSFYEFTEDALFHCSHCSELVVVNTPLSADELRLKLQQGFETPYSDSGPQASEMDRHRICENLLDKVLVGYYGGPQCPRCLEFGLERLFHPPEECPKCHSELHVREEMSWD